MKLCCRIPRHSRASAPSTPIGGGNPGSSARTTLGPRLRGDDTWKLRCGLVALLLVAIAPPAPAEYGDVVLNRRSDANGVRPVIFPHWFHRIRFRCKVCHFELGFTMRAGANDIRMDDIANGKFCGMCHNGDIAWSADRCDLCHAAKPGLKTGIHGGHETSGPGRW